MREAPLTQTRQGVDELFERLFGYGRTAPGTSAAYEVPTDVFHTADALIIRVDVPGVDPSSVEVSVQDNVVLVNGNRPFPYDASDVRFVQRGTFYGDFTQRVALGKEMDVDRISARFDAGVLELRVPYRAEVQPRRIAIEVGDQPLELSQQDA